VGARRLGVATLLGHEVPSSLALGRGQKSRGVGVSVSMLGRRVRSGTGNTDQMDGNWNVDCAPPLAIHRERDLAGAALFRASALAALTTGQTLAVREASPSHD
jgi:hypothetical protein